MSKKKLKIFESYDDKDVRKTAIKFMKDVFGLTYENHPNGYAIDLICKDKKNFDLEVEMGRWPGDLWSEEAKNYSHKSGLGFPTINIPIWRKRKYWMEKNKNKRTFFLRCNFKQIIIIPWKTIMDDTKRIETVWTAGNTNGVPETWWSFKKEDVITYNLIDGKWVLQPYGIQPKMFNEVNN